jgi:hypothetical protein
MLELCPNCHQPIIYHIPSCGAHQSAEVVVRPRMPKDRPTNETYAASEPVVMHDVTLDALLAHTTRVFKVAPEEVLSSRAQRKEALVAKRILISCAIDTFGYTQKELSSFLRCSIATVDKGITIARQMLRGTDRRIATLQEEVLLLCNALH